MKLFTFLFLTSCLWLKESLAQKQPYHYNLEVVYEMSYRPDSLNLSKAEGEFMTLLVGNEQSVFCASKYLLMDSAIVAELRKGNTLGPPMSFFQQHGTYNSQVIFKDTSTIITVENPSRFTSATRYRYTEPRSVINWTMSEDTLSIAGILCQKAMANFGNREWIAWFALSVPVSDGPYKFCGLPGLIFEVYDTKQHWSFKLASLRATSKELEISFSNNKPVPIASKEAFLSKRKYHRDNRFNLMKMSGWTFSDPVALKKDFEEQAKHDNNWIELYNGE